MCRDSKHEIQKIFVQWYKMGAVGVLLLGCPRLPLTSSGNSHHRDRQEKREGAASPLGSLADGLLLYQKADSSHISIWAGPPFQV